jgi:hypothetical protein
LPAAMLCVCCDGLVSSVETAAVVLSAGSI